MELGGGVHQHPRAVGKFDGDVGILTGANDITAAQLHTGGQRPTGATAPQVGMAMHGRDLGDGVYAA